MEMTSTNAASSLRSMVVVLQENTHRSARHAKQETTRESRGLPSWRVLTQQKRNLDEFFYS